MKTTTDMQEQLEKIIDKTSLASVLEAISDMCHLKADHVLSNWQDKELSDRWTRLGIVVNQAYSKAMQHGI